MRIVKIITVLFGWFALSVVFSFSIGPLIGAARRGKPRNPEVGGSQFWA